MEKVLVTGGGLSIVQEDDSDVIWLVSNDEYYHRLSDVLRMVQKLAVVVPDRYDLVQLLASVESEYAGIDDSCECGLYPTPIGS